MNADHIRAILHLLEAGFDGDDHEPEGEAEIRAWGWTKPCGRGCCPPVLASLTFPAHYLDLSIEAIVAERAEQARAAKTDRRAQRQQAAIDRNARRLARYQALRREFGDLP